MLYQRTHLLKTESSFLEFHLFIKIKTVIYKNYPDVPVQNYWGKKQHNKFHEPFLCHHTTARHSLKSIRHSTQS